MVHLRQEVIKNSFGGSNVKMFLETRMVFQLLFDDTHKTHLNVGLPVLQLKAQVKTKHLKTFESIRLLRYNGYHNFLKTGNSYFSTLIYVL